MQIQDFKIMFLIYKLLQFNQRLSATETNSPVEPHNPHPTMWPTVESLSRSFLLPPPPHPFDTLSWIATPKKN